MRVDQSARSTPQYIHPVALESYCYSSAPSRNSGRDGQSPGTRVRSGSLYATTEFVQVLTCLICHGDMRKDTAEVTELLLAHGCVSTTHSRDGREFVFSDGERLEVGGTCNSCDEKEIRAYIESVQAR